MARKNHDYTVLNDTGMVEGHSNSAMIQSVILRIAKRKFKIDIRTESYEFQSYATLSQWTDGSGWKEVESFNPMRDFRISVSSCSRNIDRGAFKPMIEKLTDLAIAFAE